MEEVRLDGLDIAADGYVWNFFVRSLHCVCLEVGSRYEGTAKKLHNA